MLRPWPLMALLDLDRLDTSTVFPNTKWQIHAKGLLVREVTDTIFSLDYCNLNHTTWSQWYVPCHNPPAVPGWPWCNGLLCLAHLFSLKERASYWSTKRQTSLGETYPFSTVNWQWETHLKATHILRSQCFKSELPPCHGAIMTKVLALH